MPIAETSGVKAGAAGLSAVTVATAFGVVDVPVLLGAFAGSVVFVAGAKEFHWIVRLVYLFAGTTIAYLTATWTASLLALTSVVVAAIINGVSCIFVLNGLMDQARGGKLLSLFIKLLSGLKK